jgi:hypothetical protein
MVAVCEVLLPTYILHQYVFIRRKVFLTEIIADHRSIEVCRPGYKLGKMS